MSLGKLTLTAALIAAGLLVCGWALKRSAVKGMDGENPDAVPARERLDASFTPADQYALITETQPTGPRGESPLLRRMVEAGELPPVEERLPARPVVMRGVDGIGRYGGTWLRLANSMGDTEMVANRLSAAGLVRWSPLGEPVMPFLAESYEVSPDATTFTFRLRDGLRWSDGHPFTADDIMYYWEDETLNRAVSSGTPPQWLMNGPDAPRLEQIDRLTFRISYATPNALLPKLFAHFSFAMCNSPRHYLQPYHPELGDPELIEREMAAFSMPSPRSLYHFIRSTSNPEHPRMWPWIYRSHQPDPPVVVVRNPYYYVVDEQGQQLPYLDRIQFAVVPADQFPLAVATGKTSMQLRNISFEDIVDYLSRAQQGYLDVLSWYPATRALWVLNPNITRRVAEDDPDTRWKAQYLGDKRFRQALSLAIDRPRIIEAEYKGFGEPSQVAPGEASVFHSPVLSSAYTDHDPARAEALLDELGYRRPRPGAMRQTPDGTSLVFFIDYTAFTGRGPADFIIQDWARVGVHAVARERARSLFYTQMRGLTSDFLVWSSESDYEPLLSPRYFVPFGESFWAAAWQQWGMLGGDDAPAELRSPSFQSPPKGHPAHAALALFYEARAAPTREAQAAIFRELAAIVAEEVWSIGISSYPPQPVVKDPDMKNVPENALVGWTYLTPSNAGIETYYFATPRDNPSADRQTRALLNEVVPRPRRGGAVSATDDATAGTMVGRWIVGFIWVGVALAVLLVALRHPYIGSRLLVMVPTLAVMSILIFTIIQLPPGDFLMARLIELQEQGGVNAEAEIADLREVFHFEDHVTVRYLRWVGLYWFTTFDPADTGLLQGNLGRSMASGQPVNNVIGDRLLLTMAISAGTILFTWVLAIPIGIYSAVRQYSGSDYVLTFIGFVGMSVPNFLLALVLMSVAGVSGLFSAEYATQPVWSWGKFIDLLQHIWIPIVVIGTSGTAGMIRVMRANLLDELRKPYVVTARAKGVRPLKLLIKYPVRLAINPFISGIGGLLPQLVSGGAIVAIVLALPTIGPLLLESLLLEDMYMAGSMLLVLSLLGIVGTLLSDLLLLVVDPRIRYEGSSR